MVRFRKLVKNLLEKRTPLYIFGICGIAGILVDLDHAVSLLLWWYVNPEILEGRLWHTPLLIMSGLAICYMVPHIPRLHSKLVLVGISVITGLVLVFSPEVIWRLYD